MKRLKAFISTQWTRFTSWVSSTLIKFGLWYETSKLRKVLKMIFKPIKIALYYLFFPLVLLYKKWYSKLRFDQQKVVVSIIFLTPVLFGFLVFYAYPLIMSFIYSLSTLENGAEGLMIHFGKAYISDGTTKELVRYPFYNYYYAFRVDANFAPALLSTVISTALHTIVIAIFSLLMAVLLNGEFKLRGLVRAIFFLPVIFNSEAVDVAMSGVEAVDAILQSMTNDALSSIFNMQGFLGSIGIPQNMLMFLAGITSTIYSTISYSGVQILIFLAAIQSVPKHLYEAAKIEGASTYEMFWKITLPMVSPMIMTVVVYTIIDSFLRSDVNVIIKSFRNTNIGIYAAMSWVYIIVSVLIVVIFLGLLSMVVFYQDEKK